MIGLAPTNTVARDLKRDGFDEAATVHSLLFRIKNGREALDKRTVLIVDEAAMLDSRITGQLLIEAHRAGAKVILAGDDRQLASIERGGLFAALKARHGSAEITEVTRQRDDWQRAAARDLADGRFRDAVAAFDRHGAITWTATQDAARAALVERWTRDAEATPEASRFVFAYTNADVDALNADLRRVRQARGALGHDHVFTTRHGRLAFAVGDRVQFTDTLKTARIYNGNVGIITAIDPIAGRITAVVDGDEREVTWTAAALDGFRHGYAGTIYKGQGKTLDRTYLYHTHHWRSAPSYVALTRQREWAQVFVARETAKDVRALARQMARAEVKAASVAWATADELPAAARAAARSRAMDAGRDQGEQGMQTAAASDSTEARERDVPQPSPPVPGDQPVARPSPSAASADAAAVWIPPYVDGNGRDSLGRGVDPASIAAAVAGDGRVVDEKSALTDYLAGAYRDPAGARERLDALIRDDGPLSAARRVEADPTILGALQGRKGFLAGSVARDERTRATAAARAVADSVRRLDDLQGQTARTYVASVEAQRAADTTPVPALSARAEAVVRAVQAAGSAEERAQAWTADAGVAAELKRFAAAVEKRFGDAAVRAMVGDVRAGRVQGEDVVSRVAVAVTAVKSGQGAEASQVRKLAEAQRLTQGRGLKM